MNQVYAMELQSNRNKYTMKYISDVVKIAIQKKLITIDDLYQKKEEDVISLFNKHIKSWKVFANSHLVIGTNKAVQNYFVSLDSKKRNVIPLVLVKNNVKRINEYSVIAKNIYDEIFSFQSDIYSYVKDIEQID